MGGGCPEDREREGRMSLSLNHFDSIACSILNLFWVTVNVQGRSHGTLKYIAYMEVLLPQARLE